MPDYGIAFAGGGTRGAAHVGVLLALEEEGLLPDYVAGTSAGGIVAGIYGAGVELGMMKEVVQWMSRHGNRFLDPDIIGILTFLPQLFTGQEVSLTGLLKGNRLMNFFCQLTEGTAIEEVKRKLLIPAVDLKSGDTIAFTNLMENGITDAARHQKNVRWEKTGPLCEIMMASASVPAVFQPRRVGNYCMVDGGVTNNLPVDLLIAAGVKRVVAVDIGADYRTPHDKSIMEIASHSFSIMSRDLKECRSSGEILLLKPELKKGAGLLTFEYMESCMEDGYHYTKRQMKVIKRALGRQ
ncbi:patatin-like phospholipase family protein [Hungatella hathewayi]|uniref:patatin-like phospholipase family protein n=1 Tax=Hungatella hathewayi TaxID=154046 RepID=UPI0035630818